MKTSGTHQTIKRLIPPLAAWVIGRILETPKFKGALQDVDEHAHARKKNAIRSVKRAGRNAASNPAWVAAGAVAIVIGIGLMAKATRGR